MNGEVHNPAEVGIVGRIEAIGEQIIKDPAISRRAFLGLGALGVAQMAGLTMFSDKAEGMVRSAVSTEPVMAELQQAVLLQAPQETAPLPPAETLPPEPEPSPPVREFDQVRDAVNRSYEEYVGNAELFISKLPSLDYLAATFPNTVFFHHIAEQKQHIENLNQATILSTEEFHNFRIDTNLMGAFARSGHPRIQPKMYMMHWTGEGAVNVHDLIRQMRPKSVYDYTGPDGITYQLLPDPFHRAAHGLSINEISQGHELYSGDFDDVHSPVFNFTPQLMKAFAYRGVGFLRDPGVNLPVNFTTVVGHMAADLIFWNPFYDPYSGTFMSHPEFGAPRMRKFDPPQEVLQMLVPKMMALDDELGPR